MTSRLALIVPVLLLGFGCNRSPDEVPEPAPVGVPGPAEPGESDEPAEPRESRVEVDALMALPYAGFVEEDEEEAATDGLIAFDRARSYPGYTLYSVYQLGMAVLVDHAGEIVHHWRGPEISRWEHVELMENGEILTTGQYSKDRGTRSTDAAGVAEEETGKQGHFALRMSWTGKVLWKVKSSAHHEMTRDPDGNLVVLTAAGRNERLPGDSANEVRRVRDNLLTYLTESGETIRSVSLYDMIAADPEEFPITLSSLRARKKTLADLFHANAVEWCPPDLHGRGPLYGRGHVALSMRHQDRVVIFDLEAGEMVWAWGQDVISGPHDVQWLPDGNLILLDNGVAEERSRVIEVDPARKEIVWDWQTPVPGEFFTRTKGSVERLPNGNTLVCEADNGVIFEITRDGDVVWRYVSPVRAANGRRSTLHRARRYEKDFIDGLIAKHGANPDFE